MFLCLSSLCVMGFTDDPPKKEGKVQGTITRQSTRKTEPHKPQTTTVNNSKKKAEEAAAKKHAAATKAKRKDQVRQEQLRSEQAQREKQARQERLRYNGHEWVDLGLSVKWATCNVGASSPTDYGGYYAWGETRTKSTYSWDTYFDTNDGGKTFYKYAANKKTTLELSDDAARVNWGGSWRMPTRAEQDELREKCTWTWTTQNGIKGYKVSSKLNGNTIFLPAAGHRINSDLDSTGSDGFYWSSSLNRNYPNDAFYLFVSSAKFYFFSELSCRCEGRSVRAVCPG